MASSTHLPADGGEPIESASDLGERLRAQRLQRQLTIAQVATAMHVTKPHISSIENGIHRPSVRLLAKLEDFYDLPPGELFPFIGQQRLATVAPVVVPIREPAAATATPNHGGIVDYREGITTNELATSIHKTRRAIDLLDMWLAENIRRLEGPFFEAAKRGVRTRIILLHPDLAAQHMAQTGGRSDSAAVVSENIEVLQSWYPKMQQQWQEYWREQGSKDMGEESLQLLLLPVMPVMQYHRYDYRALVGFFLHIEQTRESPQLEVQLRRQDTDHDARTTFGRSFWDEFIYFWQVLQDDAAKLARVPLPAPADWAVPPLAALQKDVIEVMQRPFKVRPHDEL